MSRSTPSTLAGRFEALLQAAPDAAAFSFHAPDAATPDGYTRAGLWQAACATAGMIAPVACGSHVMLVMPLGKELIAAHLAAQLSGCAASIFTHPSAKLAHEVYRRNLTNALTLLHPDVVVTTPEFADDLRQAAGASRIVVVDGAPAGGGPTPDAWRHRDAEGTAIIQYSSGSTGLQKGVALSNGVALRQIEQYARFIALDPVADRICSWLPLYHDMGLFTAYLMPLVTGTPVAMIDPFKWIQDPVSLLHLIERERGTLCWQPNFAFNVLATRAGAMAPGTLDVSSMRGFTNCSEPVFPQTIEQFVGALAPQGLRAEAMWVCYAMAENSFAVTACGPAAAPYRHFTIDSHSYGRGNVVPAADAAASMNIASCGVPVAECEVAVVDPETRTTLPAGRVGEVAVRSPFLFREYLNNAEATAACRDAEGWYYTGDLGFVADGHLFISGRKKDLIIVAGRNFYPQDLEKIATSCAGVIPGRVVALGDRDEQMGTERVIVVVESHAADAATRKAIAAAIRQRIFEDLDCPVGDVAVMPSRWLHKTSSGKIARRQNLARYRQWRNDEAAKAAQTAPVPTPRRASALEVAAWGFALACAAYAYLVFYVLDRNTSWNIYAGF
ncbi:MAG: AMP-binding protein [Rhodocyclales bacterium]|nr:AMP-binding protein [Rhodocyclales bacterium]